MAPVAEDDGRVGAIDAGRRRGDRVVREPRRVLVAWSVLAPRRHDPGVLLGRIDRSVRVPRRPGPRTRPLPRRARSKARQRVAKPATGLAGGRGGDCRRRGNCDLAGAGARGRSGALDRIRRLRAARGRLLAARGRVGKVAVPVEPVGAGQRRCLDPLAYSAGQLASLLFRSGILAAVFGIMLAAMLCGWAWLMKYLEINWLWSVWPIPVVLLLATRLRVGDWLLQRNRLGGWLCVGLVLVVPAAAIVAAVPYARLAAIQPPVDASAPPEPARRSTDEELATERLYEQASAAYHPDDEFMPKEHRGPEWQLPGPGKPPTEWELAWLKANRECLALTVEATRRPVSDDPRPIRPGDRGNLPLHYWHLWEPLLARRGSPRRMGSSTRRWSITWRSCGSHTIGPRTTAGSLDLTAACSTTTSASGSPAPVRPRSGRPRCSAR